jgi:prevent-host-death family protein
MTVRVGVREFRSKLSHYLDLVKDGSELVVITERGKAVAELSGPSNLERMIEEGLVRPASKPKGKLPPLHGPRLERPNLSDTVIEGRR